MTDRSRNDWQAICGAEARFCRTLDAKDWAGYAHMYTEDAILDVSDGSGVPPINGRTALVDFVRSSLTNVVTVHQVHQPEMTFNGDEATVIWAMQDRLIPEAPHPSMTGYGHYHQRWARVDDRWRIRWLKLTRLHIDIYPPTADDGRSPRDLGLDRWTGGAGGE